jgi:ubiquinone biosynthesis protein UbiJ
MPATPVWLASVEAVLNRSIDQSVKATTAARRLNGTSLQIDVDGVFGVRATVSAGRLILAGHAETAADAGISGSPLALFELLRGARAVDGRPAARIRGDAEIASRYRELFALARPDLEEELSRHIGDVPARRLAQAARGAVAWARKARHTASENLAEYLQEESRNLVNDTELQEFLHGVDRLRETADRVEARLARLENRLKGTR